MPFPTILATPGSGSGTVTVNTLPNSGQAAMQDSLPVVISVDQTPLSIKSSAPSNSSNATVTANNTAGVLLAANANRKRYSVYNDSTSVMYILEGTGTVSSSVYSYQIPAGGYYNTTEWLGIVNAIWAAANGAAHVTEYTI